MSGKGAKGLLMGKSSAMNKDKDKKKPVSRSSRAGLQVNFVAFFFPFLKPFPYFKDSMPISVTVLINAGSLLVAVS